MQKNRRRPEQCNIVDLGNLVGAFRVIGDAHTRALVRRAARVVLGPSVIRVFLQGTNEPLRRAIARINPECLRDVRRASEFEHWYERELDRISRVIRATNTGNRRIWPGYKWGHAAKVLSLFARELVLNLRYFPDHVARRLEPWLYAPIDRIALGHLQRLGLRGLGTRIKHIDTREKFHAIQDALGAAAKQAGVPRVWFDDLWLERD